ncbi:peptide methionine sulfoxide reductase MsrA [Gorgonomyces haynaldii]|nr:peptide methionine sulfoxide reductase MsrA [Gorgonomyces haynaldii]
MMSRFFSNLARMGSVANKESFPTKVLKAASGQELATFGAGCFWGVDKSFRKKFKDQGLIDAQVGYAGGNVENVTYRQVCTGQTGHAEVLQVLFDPSKLPYETLVDFFYRSHEPFTLNRQGNDTGTQYRSVIFYHSEEQKRVAEQVTAKAQSHYGSTKIQTAIEPFRNYFPGEEYHQEYLFNNPNGYECATHFERSWERIEQQYKK